jgi:glucosyl-3-phosphoglycerate phosphatase
MIFVRHGESEFNAIFNQTRQDPGIRDPELTEMGRRQALEAARALADTPVRRLISSPLRRALRTAAIIGAELDLPITVEPLIREHRVFVCDHGTPPGELARIWPEIDFAHLDEEWWGGSEPESEEEVLRRADAFRRRLAAMPDRDEVAVVCHWGFIRAVTGHEARNGELVRLDAERLPREELHSPGKIHP